MEKDVNQLPAIKRVPLLSVCSQESLDSPIDRRSAYYRQKARAAPAAAPAVPAAAGAQMRPQPLLTLPNLLTFARVAMVPAFVALWFCTHPAARPAAAAVFIAAALTDWADGFLARKLQLTTAFGAFLDPVADKLMVSAALVLLAADPPPPLSQGALAGPVILVISREICMSALREWAAASGSGAHQAVKVNSLGKWKTATQMVGMAGLLGLHRGAGPPPAHPALATATDLAVCAALGVLWVGALLALASLLRYMANVWSFFQYPDGMGMAVTPPPGASVNGPPGGQKPE